MAYAAQQQTTVTPIFAGNSKGFEPGISFLNLGIKTGDGTTAKLGPTPLKASEPMMVKLHNAFASGDEKRIAKAKEYILANIIIDWKDAEKVAKKSTAVYDFE